MGWTSTQAHGRGLNRTPSVDDVRGDLAVPSGQNSNTRSSRTPQFTRLFSEFNFDCVWNHPSCEAVGKQAPHRFAPLLAVIKRTLIYPHCHKAIGKLWIHVTSELHGVLQGIFAVGQ